MISDKIPRHEVVPAHALAADVVLQREGVNPALGLSEAEAASRLTRYGPNALLAHAPRTAFAILIDQFNSPVVWLLSAAAALAAAFSEWKEAAAILIVLVINTLIGFFTELRAIRSMEALRKLGTRSSRVRRDGKPKTVVIDIKAYKHSPLAHLAPEVIAGRLTFFRPADELSLQVDLEMTPMIGAVEAIKKKRHPGRTTLEECHTQFWEALEYTVGQHAGRLYGNPERVPKRMYRIVSAKAVHAEVMKRAHMDRERRSELLSLCIERPINLCTEMIFDAFAV